MKHNLSKIMSAAWRMFRKGVSSFAMALRMAWANAKTHNTAKEAAGITEETHTWAGWKELGFEVIHESKALYKAVISDPATKSGTCTICYFGISQVQPIVAYGVADMLIPVKAIRAKCLDCSAGSANEVKLCPVTSCPLFPYRFGKNPNIQLTAEQKAARAAHFQKMPSQQSNSAENSATEGIYTTGTNAAEIPLSAV